MDPNGKILEESASRSRPARPIIARQIADELGDPPLERVKGSDLFTAEHAEHAENS
jgi:hypothetical protein